MRHLAQTAIAIVIAAMVAYPSAGLADPVDAGMRSVAIVRDLLGSAVVTTADGTVTQRLRAGDLIIGEEQLELGDGAIVELAFFGGGTVLLTDTGRMTVRGGGASLTLEAGYVTVLTSPESRIVVEVDRDRVSILPGSFVDVSKSTSGRREVSVHNGGVLVDKKTTYFTLGPSSSASSLGAGWPWKVVGQVNTKNLRGPVGQDFMRWHDIAKRRTRGEWSRCQPPVWDSVSASEAWAYCSAVMDPCYCYDLYRPGPTPTQPTAPIPVVQSENDDSDDKPSLDDSREPTDGPPGIVVVRASEQSGVQPSSTRSFSSLREPVYDLTWARPSSARSASSYSASPGACPSNSFSMPMRRSTPSRSNSSRKKSD